jgi:hypothetical protein
VVTFRKAAFIDIGRIRRLQNEWEVDVNWQASTMAPLFPVFSKPDGAPRRRTESGGLGRSADWRDQGSKRTSWGLSDRLGSGGSLTEMRDRRCAIGARQRIAAPLAIAPRSAPSSRNGAGSFRLSGLWFEG